MNMPETTPTATSISVSSCCSLASEVWRLGRYVENLGDKQETVSLRYSIRQLSRVLDELQVSIIDLTGRSYDSGMIQEVVDVIDDVSLPAGKQLIAETISPTVSLKRNVVQTGQVTLHRSPFSVPDKTEVNA
jgi:hypothetical protein